jgi:hypothetical protein
MSFGQTSFDHNPRVGRGRSKTKAGKENNRGFYTWEIEVPNERLGLGLQICFHYSSCLNQVRGAKGTRQYKMCTPIGPFCCIDDYSMERVADGQ